MKTREKSGFAELLAEAGASPGQCAGVERLSPPAPTFEPIRMDDAISLSVQGKKAILPGKDRKGKKGSGGDCEARSTDWQGNMVRFSTSGLRMARDMDENVAWETKKEKKKPRE